MLALVAAAHRSYSSVELTIRQLFFRYTDKSIDAPTDSDDDWERSHWLPPVACGTGVGFQEAVGVHPAGGCPPLPARAKHAQGVRCSIGSQEPCPELGQPLIARPTWERSRIGRARAVAGGICLTSERGATT